MSANRDWENQMKRSSLEELNQYLITILEKAGTRSESASAVAKATITTTL